MTARMRRLAGAAVVVGLLLFIGRWTVTALADHWWGLAISAPAARFLADLAILRAALDLTGFVVATLWFTGNLLTVHRAIGMIEVSRQIANLEVREALHPRHILALFAGAGVLLGLIAGADVGRHWQAVALAWAGVRYGVADPVLGHDAGLYIAQLPLWRLLQQGALLAVAVTIVLVVVLYVFIGAIRWIDGRPGLNDHARRHLGWLLAALAITFAARFLLAPFLLVGGAEGVPAAQAYRLVSVTSLLLTGAAAFVGLASLVWAFWARHSFLLASWIIFIIGAFLARVADLSSASPTAAPLADSAARGQLDAAAYGLASLRDSVLPPGPRPAGHPPTPALWQAEALLRTTEADSAVLVAANPSWLELASGRHAAWLLLVRERGGHLAVRAVADDRVSSTGAPLYYRVNDATAAPMPAALAELPLTAFTPAAAPVLVSTELTGVPLRGAVVRTALAWALQDGRLLATQPDGARVSWARTPRDRAGKLAPFAEWSEPVLGLDSTRVLWLLDGLVSAEWFPLTARVPAPAGSVGLLRAGFVAVVDASTGAIRIFARPEGGPLADAWTTLAPGVVEPWSAMPESWRRLTDYPARLFAAQARVLAGGGTGRLAGARDSMRLLPAPEDYFWSPSSDAPARVNVHLGGTPARVRAVLAGNTRDGHLRLERFAVDSLVGLPGPGALEQSWDRFQTYVQVLDSVRAGGGMLTAGSVRYWVLPGGAGAAQVHYGPRGGGGASVTWISLAEGSRLGAGRTTHEAWSNLEGSSVPVPPGTATAGVLDDARKWFRIADSAFRRGDFTAFGRAFEALRAVLEVPP